MNIENINKMISFFGALSEDRFNMATWGTYKASGVVLRLCDLNHDCDTVACIAGWTVAHLDPEYNHFSNAAFIRAQLLLGLDNTQANDLFTPYPYILPTVEYQEVTPADVVRVLTHLRDTGEVKWA